MKRQIALCAAALLLVSAAIGSLAARRPSNTYTVRFAYVSAIPKPPRPGHARSAHEIARIRSCRRTARTSPSM